jgi:DNA-binding NtrC family response regulator
VALPWSAIVLGALLRGDRVEGLEVPVTEVGLQQRIAGSHLDDVIAVAEHAGAVELQVDFQVKRAVDPVPSDTEWQSVIAEYIAALEAALRANDGNKAAAASQLGIARSSLYRKMREYGLRSNRGRDSGPARVAVRR